MSKMRDGHSPCRGRRNGAEAVAGQRDENTVSKHLVHLCTAEEGQDGAKSSVSRVASRAISTACCRISREVRWKMREMGVVEIYNIYTPAVYFLSAL